MDLQDKALIVWCLVCLAVSYALGWPGAGA
ncbi:hypothetical protein BN948_01782 [Hydrogenophaga intermedia]|uniref:Uncharacterized protein n=1 Tax=Hydrogenophaga intermedia TaxID=65786 RepID=A0A1L1PCY2_HYDIT|nr:hypothetical protein BN948_01782 [Hydrogenophaga intermedia]